MSAERASHIARRDMVVETGVEDPVRSFLVRLPDLIRMAAKARKKAIDAHKKLPESKRPNERGFYVGVSAGSFSSTHIVEMADINTMPRGKSGERVCAEERVLQRLLKAQETGLHYTIPGIVIIGDPQPDRATGAVTETLLPCGETCWPSFFTGNWTGFNGDALVVTMRSNEPLKKGQVQTVSELNKFYSELRDGGDPMETNVFSKNQQAWNQVGNEYDALMPPDVDPLASRENWDLALEVGLLVLRGNAPKRGHLQLV